MFCVPSIWSILAKKINCFWGEDNSLGRQIQIAGKREKVILKWVTHTGLETAKSTTVSHAILSSISNDVYKLHCFCFPYQNKLPKVHRRPRSWGHSVWCLVLDVWLIQAGLYSPGCSEPRKAPAEEPWGLQAQWVSVDPRQVSTERKVTSLRMQFSGQGRFSMPVAPRGLALSSLRCVSHFGTALPLFFLSALLLCSVHPVLMLFPGSGVSGTGAARAEEPWRCSACIEWLAIWIKALFIQGDTGEQWQQTSALLGLACSPLPFRTELLPANTPPPKLAETAHRCLMGPTGDVGPCLRAQWVSGEK